MLTRNDIINVSFRKSGFSGYRTDDVDAFIDQIRDSYEVLTKKNIEQKEENEQFEEEKKTLLKKLEILAAKVEEYRQEEDEIKNALVSAQKLGDASVREARHKAEIIVKDAGLKAEKIIAAAEDDIKAQRRELDTLKKSVSDFRARLLSQYKEHLTLIDALPSVKEAPPQSAPKPAPVPVPSYEPAPAPVSVPAYEPAPAPVSVPAYEPAPAPVPVPAYEPATVSVPAYESVAQAVAAYSPSPVYEEEEESVRPVNFTDTPHTGTTTRFNTIQLDDDLDLSQL